jgi:hypothetical protein
LVSGEKLRNAAGIQKVEVRDPAKHPTIQGHPWNEELPDPDVCQAENEAH